MFFSLSVSVRECPWPKKSLIRTNQTHATPPQTPNQLPQPRALVRHRLILPPPPHALMHHRLHRPHVLTPHGLVEALVLIVLARRKIPQLRISPVSERTV